jgi:hypothetical protein
VSPVRYELGFYIPEDGILHSHHHGNLISYILKRMLSRKFLNSRSDSIVDNLRFHKKCTLKWTINIIKIYKSLL